MYQWIESIRIENAIPMNLEFHQKRINATLSHFGQMEQLFDLSSYLALNRFPSDAIYKARIIYSLQGIESMTTSRYKMLRPTSFELVKTNELCYAHKNVDRGALNKLKQGSMADEIIIVQQGFITDTSYSNLILLKNDRWYTPHTFLLNGTMRQKLLSTSQIEETSICTDDLECYSHFKMINAMMPPEVAYLFSIDLLIK